jgi:hypothetical protein
MATWIKTPNNSYVQISQVRQANVQFNLADDKYWIYADTSPVKGPYDTAALAQADLDGAIVNLGGSL